MSLSDIRSRLAVYRPATIEDPALARAAVALVIGGHAERMSDVLLIRRAARDNDPWSGHIAFPGGRSEPQDADLTATAVREAREEVGIDLAADAQQIGRLDDLRAMVRMRPVDLVISPLVFVLNRPVTLELCAREVEGAIWVPLAFLRSEAACTTHVRIVDGAEIRFPAFSYQGYTIWGLTHRILTELLDLASP